MLIKHEIFKDVHPIEMSTVSAAMEEARVLISDIEQIRDSILSFRAGDMDEFELVECTEPYAIFNYSNLSLFNASVASVNQIVNKYLGQVLAKLVTFRDNLNKATDCVFQLEDDEFTALIDQAYDVISGFVFFVLVEFGVFAVADGSTDIDEVFDGYCRKHMLDPKEEATKLKELSNEYRMRVELFDACPEIEELFYVIMGPDVIGVDFTKLTLDMAHDVVTGVITPAQLIAQLQDSDDEEDK